MPGSLPVPARHQREGSASLLFVEGQVCLNGGPGPLMVSCWWVSRGSFNMVVMDGICVPQTHTLMPGVMVGGTSGWALS